MDSSPDLPSLLMRAAHSAAAADGVCPPKDAVASAGGTACNDGHGRSEAGPAGDGINHEIEIFQVPPPALPAMPAPPGMDDNNAALNRILSNLSDAAQGSPAGGAVDPAALLARAANVVRRRQDAPPAAPAHAPEVRVVPLAPEPASAAVPVERSQAKKQAASSSGAAPLRRGKWTPEEEEYAARLIQEFKAGLLPLTDGTTLRTFLSKLLNCDPMRISKKFVGSNCIGKQVFRRRGADVNSLTPDEIERTRFELSELEKKFLDRVAQSKSSKAGGNGRGSRAGAAPSAASSSRGATGMAGGMNKSAAAVGRALLQGNKPPPQRQSQSQRPQPQGAQHRGGADPGGDAAQSSAGAAAAGGLLAQLQAQQPGMFDSGTAWSFLNATGGGSQAGGLGNMNANASITNLMLQTGMSRDQISQLAQQGISSSASLANMLGKQRSFDQLMSLDFQSMQSIDNLANLIQAGMPGQAGVGGASASSRGGVPKGGMKNVDWGPQVGAGPGAGNPLGGAASANAAAAGLLSTGLSNARMKGSIENLVRTLSSNIGGSKADSNAAAPTASQNVNNFNNQANLSNATNFNNFLQNAVATQQGSPLLGGVGGQGGNSSINNLLQSLTQQNQQQQQQQQGNINQLNYGNLLQGMGGTSLLQSNNVNNPLGGNLSQNNNNGVTNDLMNMLGQSAAGNLSQQNNLNPLMQQFNDPYGGLQSAASTAPGNPMMAALAQQQFLAQAAQQGGGNNVSSLLGQQGGLVGLTGGMNNSLGGFGAALGGAAATGFGGGLGAGLGTSSVLGAPAPGGGGNQNAAALLQQLLSQHGGWVGGNPAAGALPGARDGGGEGHATLGNKRGIDDTDGGGEEEGGPSKKQLTVSL